MAAVTMRNLAHTWPTGPEINPLSQPRRPGGPSKLPWRNPGSRPTPIPANQPRPTPWRAPVGPMVPARPVRPIPFRFARIPLSPFQLGLMAAAVAWQYYNRQDAKVVAPPGYIDSFTCGSYKPGDCGIGVQAHAVNRTTIDPNDMCDAGQAVHETWHPLSNLFYYGPARPISGTCNIKRMTFQEGYLYPLRWPGPYSYVRPASPGVPMPIPGDVMSPPVADPIPVSPGRSPSPAPEPYAPPYMTRPVPTYTTDRNGNLRRSLRPHAQTRPLRTERPERKFKIVLGKLGKFYGGLTEMEDLADAIIDAATSPDAHQCKYQGTLQGKWSCIADNYKDFDPADAAINFAVEQFKDYVIGKVGDYGKKAVASAAEQGLYKRPVGLTHGFWSQRAMF